MAVQAVRHMVLQPQRRHGALAEVRRIQHLRQDSLNLDLSRPEGKSEPSHTTSAIPLAPDSRKLAATASRSNAAKSCTYPHTFHICTRMHRLIPTLAGCGAPWMSA